MEAGAALELDTLRKQWRGVLSLTSMMVGLCLVAGIGFAVATSGILPFAHLDFLTGQPWSFVVAIGLLFGVMMLAASPPVTMAVIHETKSKGTYTDTLLTSVIINNIEVVILFAVALVFTQSVAGVSGGHGASAVITQLTWSLILGAGVAAAAAGALRFMRKDSLLALVGLCFAGSWLASELGASPLLTFLSAGVLLNTCSQRGRPFKLVASTLSGPVYVLFFTLVGADLHVDALTQMAPYALTLVGLRLLAYFGSVRVAARLAAIPPALAKHGWMGLAPQAGIALTVALAVGHDFPGWGQEFETLGLAAIALNEMLGPILLKVSLGLSGETGDARAARATEATRKRDAPQESPLPWHPVVTDQGFDPWGGPPATGDGRLDQLALEVHDELQSLVKELRAGPIRARRDDAHAFLQVLRREFLRTLRRTRVQGIERGDGDIPSTEFVAFLRAQRADLAGRWKTILLDRAAMVDMAPDKQAMESLLDRVDQAADALPAAVTAPYRPGATAHAVGDRTRVRMAKALLKTRLLLGSARALQVIEARALGRYHLQGTIPGYLHDVAGLLALWERHVLTRARNLFASYDRHLQALIDEARQLEAISVDLREDRLSSLRTEMEQELQLASDEVDQLEQEATHVAASALGRAYRAFVDDLPRAGTPDLPSSAFRFSKVYERRQQATTRLMAGLDVAERLTRGTVHGLAMELELVMLESQIEDMVDATCTMVGRDLRGRISLQLQRVAEALDAAEASLDTTLSSPPKMPKTLLKRLDDAIIPLGRVVEEAVHIAEQHHAELVGTSPFQPLVSHLSAAVDELTDRYQVVFDQGTQGRGLPREAPLVLMPFRSLVRSFMEVDATRELGSLAQDLQEAVEQSYRHAQDIDRVLAFNAELARAEVEVLGRGTIPSATLQMVRQTLGSVLTRLQERVRKLEEDSQALARRTDNQARAAILGRIGHLRRMIVGGQIGEIRARMNQDRLRDRRREIQGAAAHVSSILRKVAGLARSTVGEEAMQEARRVVGLPDHAKVHTIGVDTFEVPEANPSIPIAYKRLFSDPALDAGDLLVGREQETTRLRQVLTGDIPGANRAVAIIGAGGMSKEAMVQALLRGLHGGSRVVRISLTEPIRCAADLEEQLQTAMDRIGNHPRPIMVLEGFQWLFSMEPGGFDGLRVLVSKVVQTSTRIAWIVSAEAQTWAYADRLVPLHDAFPEQLHMGPLSQEALARAVMARHNMSGMNILFQIPAQTLGWWLREQIEPTAREQNACANAYFKILHDDSGGYLWDALHLWLASVEGVMANGARSEGSLDTMVIGAPVHPPISAIRDLPDDVLVTLRQIARQGRITPNQHAEQFRLEPDVSHALLSRLAHWGLLRRSDGERFRLRKRLAGPISRVLAERGLAE
jgi:hypothetical protein